MLVKPPHNFWSTPSKPSPPPLFSQIRSAKPLSLGLGRGQLGLGWIEETEHHFALAITAVAMHYFAEKKKKTHNRFQLRVITSYLLWLWHYIVSLELDFQEQIRKQIIETKKLLDNWIFSIFLCVRFFFSRNILYIDFRRYIQYFAIISIQNENSKYLMETFITWIYIISSCESNRIEREIFSELNSAVG